MGQYSITLVDFQCKFLFNGPVIAFQGFHRYSTDAYWHVPHFEKMLYDQGQLAEAYADCYALTKDESLKETLCKILDYVKRDLRHPVSNTSYQIFIILTVLRRGV